MPFSDPNKKKEYDRKYRKLHSQEENLKDRIYRNSHKKEISLKDKIYRKKNRIAISKKLLKYQLKRYKEDPNFRMRRILRERLRNSVKHCNRLKLNDLLGCSIEYFINYIENQFKPGMTWENHGTHGWHIDHIKPCASFDLTNQEQQKQCFHYTNLQPLWCHENLAKGDKII